MSELPETRPEERSAAVEQALADYLARVAEGDAPDLQEAAASLPTAEDRSEFRVEALAAEYTWHLEDDSSVPLDEYLALTESEGERLRLASAIEAAHEAERRLPWHLEVGTRVAGRYEVLAERGRGGIGVVYEARDLELGRRVALKAVRVEPDRDVAALAESLIAESRILAGLASPNIVAIHDILREQGRVCIVLSLVEGISLEEAIDILGRAEDGVEQRLTTLRRLAGTEEEEPRGALAEQGWYRFVAAVIAQLARTLEGAHSEGVLHRDIKPQNVMLGRDGEPVLLDFGLARSVDAGDEGRSFQGTPEYLAPEQVTSMSTGQDPRTDVYALGVVAYELLALRRAYPRADGEGLTVLFGRIRRGVRTPLVEADRHVPPTLVRICEHAMGRDLRRRYTRAGELAEDLERWLAGRPPKFAPLEWHHRVPLWVRRAARPALALILVGLAAWFVSGLLEPTYGQALVSYIVKSNQSPAAEVLGPERAPRDGELIGVRLKGDARAYLYSLSAYVDAQGVKRVAPVKPRALDRVAHGWSLQIDPGDRNDVFAAKAEGENRQEGLIVFVCPKRQQWLEDWLDSLDEGTRDDRYDAVAETYRLATAAVPRGGEITSGEFAQHRWGDAGAEGEELPGGILRYEQLFEVER